MNCKDVGKLKRIETYFRQAREPQQRRGGRGLRAAWTLLQAEQKQCGISVPCLRDVAECRQEGFDTTAQAARQRLAQLGHKEPAADPELQRERQEEHERVAKELQAYAVRHAH